jgi:hypothetical protein
VNCRLRDGGSDEILTWATSVRQSMGAPHRTNRPAMSGNSVRSRDEFLSFRYAPYHFYNGGGLESVSVCVCM